MPSCRKQEFNALKRGDAGRTTCSKARRAVINICYTTNCNGPSALFTCPSPEPVAAQRHAGCQLLPAHAPVPAAVAGALIRREGRREGKEEGRSGGGRPPVARAKATPQRPQRGQNVGGRRGPAGRGPARGKAAARAGLGLGAAGPCPARPAHYRILPAGAESGRQPPGVRGARRAERSMAGQGGAVQVRRPCAAGSSAQSVPCTRVPRLGSRTGRMALPGAAAQPPAPLDTAASGRL